MSSSISRNFILSVAWAKALESSLPSCTSSAIAISHHAPHFLPFLEHLFWENCLTTLSCPFVSPSELSCLRDFFPSNNYVYLLSPPLDNKLHDDRDFVWFVLYCILIGYCVWHKIVPCQIKHLALWLNQKICINHLAEHLCVINFES